MRGFTFLEILVALGVAGIMTAIAIPSLSRFRARLDIDKAAKHVAQELAWARSRAMADVTAPCGMTFSEEERTFSLFLDRSRSGSDRNRFDAADTILKGPYKLPEGVVFVAASSVSDILHPDYPQATVFRGDGSAQSDIGVELQVSQSRYGYTRRINILPSTGRIKVEAP